MQATEIPKKQSFVRFYSSKNFSVIPLQRNSKQPAISWAEFQKRRMTDEEILLYFQNGNNVAIVTGTISSLVVIDADTQETVEFLEQFEEFKGTAKVRTRRGIHYYFRVPDLPESFGTQKLYKDPIRIDIKANGGYVVAPPSVVEGHEYTWIGHNGTKDTMRSLSFWELQNLLTQMKKRLGLEQEQEYVDEKAESEKTKNIIDVDFKKLEQILKLHYNEGNRQNLIIYIAGLLGKLGYDLDTVLAFVTKIVNSRKDPELKMRIAGVRHTFQKLENKQPVKGITGLLELGISEDELKKAFVIIGTETQQVKVIIPNVTELLREFCEEHSFKIDYDEFYVKIFLNDCEISREMEIKIQSELEQKINKRIPDDVFLKAIESIAYEHKRDRLKEFLTKCKAKWDGVPRIHTFFHDVFGTPLSQYACAVSKNFFVSAIARAFNPGCFQKNIVVIQGLQNVGKSRALMTLGREFHREINVSITTEKDFYMAIQGVWLAEIPEMDALRKAHRNRVKAIISSTIDRFRPPYSRHVKDFPRRCVFTCTTNDQTIFDDPTGGTRFWIIEALQKANIEYIDQYREQLFGEAVCEFEKGYKFWEIDETEASEVQENARHHDEWEQIIAEYIEHNNIDVTTVTEIAERVLDIPLKDLDKSKQMRVAECLQLLGFRKKTIRDRNKTKKVWIKGATDMQDTSNEPF